MGIGAKIKRFILTLFLTLLFTFTLSSCRSGSKYSDVEIQFIRKYNWVILEEKYTDLKCVIYQDNYYYFFHYSFLNDDTKKEYERVSVWHFDRSLGEMDLYEEDADIYIKPYSEIESYSKLYNRYLSAAEGVPYREYTESDFEDIRSTIEKERLEMYN